MSRCAHMSPRLLSLALEVRAPVIPWRVGSHRQAQAEVGQAMGQMSSTSDIIAQTNAPAEGTGALRTTWDSYAASASIPSKWMVRSEVAKGCRGERRRSPRLDWN